MSLQSPGGLTYSVSSLPRHSVLDDNTNAAQKHSSSCYEKNMGPLEAYHYLMEEASDPRVTDWPLMKNPFSLLSIVLIYLLVVVYIGPMYMKNREPYSLRRFMICYNVCIAIASGLVFYGLLTSGYTTKFSWGCEPMDYSFDAESMRMTKWVWWSMLLKIGELCDTFIFVLRKKFNQSSFLHIYHHASVVCTAWIACKYASGGMWTFNIMVNCIVHIIMYSYYCFTSLGINVQMKLIPWKPYLTMLQIVQFVIMIVHTSQALIPSCEPTKKPLAYFYVVQIIIMFYLFLKFYKKTYQRRKTL